MLWMGSVLPRTRSRKRKREGTCCRGLGDGGKESLRRVGRANWIGNVLLSSDRGARSKNEKQVSPDVRIRANQFYKKHVSLQQGCVPIAEPSGDLRMGCGGAPCDRQRHSAWRRVVGPGGESLQPGLRHMGRRHCMKSSYILSSRP